jgi:hypothetical protein
MQKVVRVLMACLNKSLDHFALEIKFLSLAQLSKPNEGIRPRHAVGDAYTRKIAREPKKRVQPSVETTDTE